MAWLQLLLVFCVAALASGVPTGDEQRRHRGPKDLSDQEHFAPEHNAEYDHEAFLGKDQAERFDQLSPEEAKRRLSMIVDKIDKDKDGQVTQDELKIWVQHVAKRYIYEDVDRQWSYHDKNNDNLISWQEYKEGAFGNIDNPDEVYDHHRQLSYKDVLARDERRFKAADTDSDGKLNREEFATFLHPEETKHMREIVIDETLHDMDKDKDGYVTLEEYINDLWPQYEREGVAEGEEPDWVKSEKEQFGTYRDKDSDGKLNREEIGEWVLPQDYDHAEAEARHLIHEADINKDGQLTREEVLQHQDLFVGSQATDFGEYLVRHDEF